MNSNALTLLGLSAAVCIWSACADEAEEGRTYRGEHVALVLASDGAYPCTGTTVALDRYIELVFDALGAEVPDGFVLTVVETRKNPCGFQACFLPEENKVYLLYRDIPTPNTIQLMRHEMAHAIAYEVMGRGAPFLEEGLAESFGHYTGAEYPVQGEVDISGLSAQTPGEVDYSSAGRFVHYLLQRMGPEAFVIFYRGSRGKTQDAIVHEMEAVLGESLEEILNDYESERRCASQIDPCGATPGQAVSLPYSEISASSCEVEDAVGYYSGVAWGGVQLRTLHLERAGLFRVTSTRPLLWTACDESCSRRVVEPLFSTFSGDGAEGVVLDLRPGQHVIQIEAGGERGDGVLELSITPYAPGSANSSQ